ncbi:MAG: hypothetical protein K2X27_14330 [Candidatus Obscuribacterales bacterium]|nr:hypothetical protein [Candidatus Obscuribacterales bacterium]
MSKIPEEYKSQIQATKNGVSRRPPQQFRPLIGLSFLLILAIMALLASDFAVSKSRAESLKKENEAPKTASPVARPEIQWQMRHNYIVNQRVRTGSYDLLILGDSITQGMNLKILQKYFGMRVEAFGIGGDRTQNLLWRIQHGEIDFRKQAQPKTVVVLIGTNNLVFWPDSPPSTPSEIAEGVAANIKEIRKRLPASQILALGLLPRAEDPKSPLRAQIIETNTLLKKLQDHKHIFYADLGAKFLDPSGKIKAELMPDFLHPGFEAGNELLISELKAAVDSIKPKQKN